jgi:hypothetical protein
MPNYVPTPDDLDLVRKAVEKYEPQDFAAYQKYRAFMADRRRWAKIPLPICKLLCDFEAMSMKNWPGDAASWPAGINRAVIPSVLFDHPESLTLALAIAILWPDWNKDAAHLEYLWMRNRLLTAWAARQHTESQKRRKTFDEVVAFGAQHGAGWPVAKEVLYSHVFGACLLSSLFLEGPPLGGGLIPDLSAAWGTDFRDEVAGHAVGIRVWLQSPSANLPFKRGSFLEFTGSPDGCQVLGYLIPPGSKRNFVLTQGAARLVDHSGVLIGEVPAGQRLMLGSFDEGESRIRIAHLQLSAEGQTVAGPELKISAKTPCGRLLFDSDSSLEMWSCTCGLYNCDKKHRLRAWDPAAMPPRAGLKNFLWTAVKGPGGGRVVQLGKFVGNMYYAYLCEGVA